MGNARSVGAVEALRHTATLTRPTAPADEQRLEVDDTLHPLLTGGGLRRGTVVGVAGPGATTLTWALLARASRSGSWIVTVGLGDLGLVAAAETGIDLGRTAVVPPPEPRRWATVVATLLEAVDVVVAAPPRSRVGGRDARRLASRARDRGSVLVLADGGRAWPEAADLLLTTADPEWDGLGWGHGHLTRRRLTVWATGRREAARPRRVDLWLPATTRPVAPADPPARELLEAGEAEGEAAGTETPIEAVRAS